MCTCSAKCVCPPEENGLTYKETSAEKCKAIRFACDPGFAPFHDEECGCGCKPEPTKPVKKSPLRQLPVVIPMEKAAVASFEMEFPSNDGPKPALVQTTFFPTPPPNVPLPPNMPKPEPEGVHFVTNIAELFDSYSTIPKVNVGVDKIEHVNWPTYAKLLPAGTVNGVDEAAVLVANGFFATAKMTPGFEVALFPASRTGDADSRVVLLPEAPEGPPQGPPEPWFYHEAYMVAMNSDDELLDVIAARAFVPFGERGPDIEQAETELVWAQQPERADGKWVETVIMRQGPGVSFRLAHLDKDDESRMQIIAAEFFAKQRLVIYECVTTVDGKTDYSWENCVVAADGSSPNVRETVISTQGRFFNLELVDLNGDGQTDILATQSDHAPCSVGNVFGFEFTGDWRQASSWSQHALTEEGYPEPNMDIPCPPTGAGGPPTGAGGAPTGAGGAPTGAGGPPTGAGGPPTGAGGAPTGADGAPTGPPISPGGSPGYAQAFFPKTRRSVSGRPHILVSADDGGFVDMLVPVGNAPWKYTRHIVYDARVEGTPKPGTVGSPAIGDVNKDGYTDIAIPSYTKGEILLFTFSGCRSDDECMKADYCKKAACGKQARGTCERREPEDTLCPTQYDPVCDCEGNTHSNDCVALTKSKNVAYKGECVKGECTLEDGTVVEDGWEGEGRGKNHCNRVWCADGILGSTKMLCFGCAPGFCEAEDGRCVETLKCQVAPCSRSPCGDGERCEEVCGTCDHICVKPEWKVLPNTFCWAGYDGHVAINGEPLIDGESDYLDVQGDYALCEKKCGESEDCKAFMTLEGFCFFRKEIVLSVRAEGAFAGLNCHLQPQEDGELFRPSPTAASISDAGVIADPKELPRGEADIESIVQQTSGSSVATPAKLVAVLIAALAMRLF